MMVNTRMNVMIPASSSIEIHTQLMNSIRKVLLVPIEPFSTDMGVGDIFKRKALDLDLPCNSMAL
jgi:hypothetical protein